MTQALFTILHGMAVLVGLAAFIAAFCFVIHKASKYKWICSICGLILFAAAVMAISASCTFTTITQTQTFEAGCALGVGSLLFAQAAFAGFRAEHRTKRFI